MVSGLFCFLCFTSSVSLTSFYTEDEPKLFEMDCLISQCLSPQCIIFLMKFKGRRTSLHDIITCSLKQLFCKAYRYIVHTSLLFNRSIMFIPALRKHAFSATTSATTVSFASHRPFQWPAVSVLHCHVCEIMNAKLRISHCWNVISLAYCTLRNETKRNHCETKPKETAAKRNQTKPLRNETRFQTQFYINDIMIVIIFC